MKLLSCLATILLAAAAACAADASATRPDSAPDPLLAADGTRITTAEQWRTKRRPELLALFAREMFGQMPAAPRGEEIRFEPIGEPGGPGEAFGGKAIQKQVRIVLMRNGVTRHIDLLVYLPTKAARPVPAILAMNFWGNQATTADPAVVLPTSYLEGGRNKWVDLRKIKDHRADESTRGINAGQWPIEAILDRGYALAMMYRCDIDPDVPERWQEGVRGLFPELHEGPDNFTAMGAWAWGFSRGIDCLQTLPEVDAKRIAIFGWSRLGKAALWAGACDERIGAVLSQESGAGGAKLFRRGIGEDVRRLNTNFPHWYCTNFRQYIGRDTTLPFDANELIALSAPRPVFVASSRDDLLFDPEGEFWATRFAAPVYDLLEPSRAPALPADAWPPASKVILGTLGYYVRPGHHDVTLEDWQAHLAFLDEHFKAPAH